MRRPRRRSPSRAGRGDGLSAAEGATISHLRVLAERMAAVGKVVPMILHVVTEGPGVAVPRATLGGRMNRRSFLSLLGSGALGAAAHTLDLDKLLWVPGQKTIFLPPLPAVASDSKIGISIRFVKEWDIVRPPLLFHENAFQFVMAPLEPSRPFSREDLADVEAVVTERWMSSSEFERWQQRVILSNAEANRTQP
jgi:hypothetical protein